MPVIHGRRLYWDVDAASHLLRRQNGSSGLSAGAVGGIFVAIFFGILLIIILVWFVLRSRGYELVREEKRTRRYIERSSVRKPQRAYMSQRETTRTWYRASTQANPDIGGFGRSGYLPRETEFRRQRQDPTYVPKLDIITRLVVGPKVTEYWEVRPHRVKYPSPLSSLE